MNKVILVPPRPQTDLVTLVFKGDSPVPSEYAPSGPHLDLVTLVHTWASSGYGSTAWPPGWPHLDLVSVIATWASPMPCDSGPHVGLLDLVNLVLTWSFPRTGTLVTNCASPGPGESGTPLGLNKIW